MATTIVNVARSSGNINQDRRTFSFGDKIFDLDKDRAPLVAISSRLNSKAITDPNMKWLEDAPLPTSTTLNGAILTSSDSFSVATGTGAYFAVDDIIKVTSTGETMLVTAISTDDITVSRSMGDSGGTAVAAAADGATLLIIGNSFQEGTGSRASKTTTATTKYNYAQIIKTPFELTKTEQEMALRGGKDMPRQQSLAATKHSRDWESALIFGERSGAADTGSTPRRQLGGLLYWITTNVTTSGGMLTTTEVETWARSIFRYGPSQRIVFASPLVMSAFTRLGLGDVRIKTRDTAFGIQVRDYITAHGTLSLVKHDLLVGDYSGYAIALDMDKVGWRPLRPTTLETNIQANDADTTKHQFITEASLELNLEKHHGVLKGVTG